MITRFIDAGTVSYLRSQSIYHGLAHAWTSSTPNTIILLSPKEPYVSIGLHQTLEREVDVEFCRRRCLPIVRRQVGGGAVYLDRNQLFVQWVFRSDDLPRSLAERFGLFVAPIVETLRELGIDAVFRPPNDIHVDGRKICGTGAARIGGAEVIVGNFIFDFDTECMARLLPAPTARFRATVARGLVRYLTTIKRELGTSPDPQTVKSLYLRKTSDLLGKPLVPGGLSCEEVKGVEALDEKLASPAFLEAGGGLRRPGVKIHEGVYVAEVRHRSSGGVIRVTARRRDNRLEDVSVTGEFATDLTPALRNLERALDGVEVCGEALTRAIQGWVRTCGRKPPEIAVEEWVAAVMKLGEAR